MKERNEMENPVFKKVYDLGAGAYLMQHGYKAIKRTKDKAIVFVIDSFDVAEFDEKQIDYLNSEYHRFDSCLMSLKKLNVNEEKEKVDTDKVLFKKVYDLGAGAYLMQHGYKAIKRTKDKAIVFSIDPSDDNEFNEKQIDYLNSEFHRFDSCLMSLKKLSVYE